MNHIKINHDLFHSHRFSHPVLQLCLFVWTGTGNLDGEISKAKAMSKKLYFSKYDGFEWAHPISRWKEIMQEEGIKTIELIRAKADRGTGYFFCNEYQEFGESKDSCGKQCDKYSPRNGKNGICRHNDPPYEPDESETLTLNRKT